MDTDELDLEISDSDVEIDELNDSDSDNDEDSDACDENEDPTANKNGKKTLIFFLPIRLHLELTLSFQVVHLSAKTARIGLKNHLVCYNVYHHIRIPKSKMLEQPAKQSGIRWQTFFVKYSTQTSEFQFVTITTQTRKPMKCSQFGMKQTQLKSPDAG